MSRTINVNLTKEKKVNLYFVNDVHVGAIGFAERRFRKYIERIRKDPHAKVILNGDYIDGMASADSRYSPEDIDPKYNTIDRQYLAFKGMLMPIKDKILGISMGNHDFRLMNRVDFDLPRVLAKELDVPHAGDIALYKIKVGKKLFRVLAFHGASGSTTIGGILNVAKKYADNLEQVPDIMAMGHVHRIDIVPYPKLKDSFKTKMSWLAICGSFLDAYKNKKSNYAKRKFYGALPIGSVMFTLKDDGDMVGSMIIMNR